MENEMQRLIKIQSELTEQKLKLKATKKEEQQALSILYVIKNHLRLAQKNLANAKGRVQYNQTKMKELIIDLSGAEKKISIRSKETKKRIIEVYKSGSEPLLDIIFASKTMADFINRTYYFGRVIANDAELLGTVKEQVNIIKRTRVELEGANREIGNMVKVIETEKKSIVQASAAKERIYQSLKARRIEYERHVKQLEASSYEIERFIKKRGTSATISTGKFIWPLRGRITSTFGYRRHPIWGGINLHTGLDIAAPYGKPITAADKGEVIFSGWWGGYGKALVIDHGRGYTTVYGHMSRIYMQAGQTVDKGQVIGLVGSTGFSTGPHLHFEVRVNGRPVDPSQFLN
jgi:murein DD-endopeptidase MepM/ murein hydrolase activator NlpD